MLQSAGQLKGASFPACWARSRGTLACLARQAGAAGPDARHTHAFAAAQCSLTPPFKASGCTPPAKDRWQAAGNSIRPSHIAAAAAVGLLQPSYTFEECTQEILRCAAPSATPEQRSEGIAKLAACRDTIAITSPNSWWLLVQCGTWLPDAAPPAGPAGTPARAVLCFTYSSAKSKRDLDARAFALDSNGLPIGVMYVDIRGRASVTAFELRTSKYASKKYRASCILIEGGRFTTSVASWLDETFGKGTNRRHAKEKRAAEAAAAAEPAEPAAASGAERLVDSSSQPRGSRRRPSGIETAAPAPGDAAASSSTAASNPASLDAGSSSSSGGGSSGGGSVTGRRRRVWPAAQ